jgi:hypothetical protein
MGKGATTGQVVRRARSVRVAEPAQLQTDMHRVNDSTKAMTVFSRTTQNTLMRWRSEVGTRVAI